MISLALVWIALTCSQTVSAAPLASQPAAVVRPFSNSTSEVPVVSLGFSGDFSEGFAYADLHVDSELRAQLNEIVQAFDKRVYPRFVNELTPDPLRAERKTNKIILLFDSLKKKVPAYHSRHLSSTGRDIILIDIDSVRATNYANYYLPHELQHVFRSHLNAREADWLNEGLSKFAEFYENGREFPVGYLDAFSQSQGPSLIDGGLSPNSSTLYFNDMFFVYYLFQHFGGIETIRLMMSSPLSGIANVNAALAATSARRTAGPLQSYYTFEKAFTNYQLALLLNAYSSRLESGDLWNLKLDQDVGGADVGFHVQSSDLPANREIGLSPYSSRSFEINRKCFQLTFSPTVVAALVDLEYAGAPVRTVKSGETACVSDVKGSGQFLLLVNLSTAARVVIR